MAQIKASMQYVLPYNVNFIVYYGIPVPGLGENPQHVHSLQPAKVETDSPQASA